MSKLTNLAISALIAVPLFGIANTVAQNSKTQIKGNLDLCELKTGERGYIKGQVVSINKGDWGTKLVTLGEGTQGCRVTLKTHPFKDPLLQNLGNRVKVLVKVETEGFASVINNKASEALDVIGADGSIVPVESTEQKLNSDVLNRLKKYEKATLNITDESTSYLFTKEILNQIEPGVTYRWYYQSAMSGLRIVNRVEVVN